MEAASFVPRTVALHENLRIEVRNFILGQRLHRTALTLQFHLRCGQQGFRDDPSKAARSWWQAPVSSHSVVPITEQVVPSNEVWSAAHAPAVALSFVHCLGMDFPVPGTIFRCAHSYACTGGRGRGARQLRRLGRIEGSTSAAPLLKFPVLLARSRGGLVCQTLLLRVQRSQKRRPLAAITTGVAASAENKRLVVVEGTLEATSMFTHLLRHGARVGARCDRFCRTWCAATQCQGRASCEAWRPVAIPGTLWRAASATTTSSSGASAKNHIPYVLGELLFSLLLVHETAVQL